MNERNLLEIFTKSGRSIGTSCQHISIKLYLSINKEEGRSLYLQQFFPQPFLIRVYVWMFSSAKCIDSKVLRHFLIDIMPLLLIGHFDVDLETY